MKRLIYVLPCFLLTACAAMHPDLALSQAEADGLLAEGMTVAEVSEIIGRNPSTIQDTIRRESGGTLYMDTRQNPHL